MDIFKIALPGSNVHQANLGEEVLDSRYPSPKISMTASLPHAGIIFLNWATTGIIIPKFTVRLLYSFPHGYNHIPTVFQTYTYDNGTRVLHGMFRASLGLGIMLMDTDDTNVNLKYISGDLGSNPIPPFIMKIRFYVMAERGYE